MSSSRNSSSNNNNSSSNSSSSSSSSSSNNSSSSSNSSSAVTAFVQLLLKRRRLTKEEASSFLLSFFDISASPSLNEFINLANERIKQTGFMLQTVYDGEEVFLVLIQDITLISLISSLKDNQKIINKLLPLNPTQAACTAALLYQLIRRREGISIKEFVCLCAEHRLPSPQSLLKILLNLNLLTVNSEGGENRLSVGTNFFSDILPELQIGDLRLCAVCSQPAISNFFVCSRCGVETHKGCAKEIRREDPNAEHFCLNCGV